MKSESGQTKIDVDPQFWVGKGELLLVLICVVKNCLPWTHRPSSLSTCHLIPKYIMHHRIILGKIPTSAGLKNAYTKIRGRWVGKSSQHMGIECIFKWLILESVQSFSFFVLLWELCLLLVSSVYDYSLLVLRKVLSSFINVSRAVLSRRIFKVFVVEPFAFWSFC